MEARPRPKIAMVERREARVPPTLRDAGRLASAPARRVTQGRSHDAFVSCVTRRATGCRCTRAPNGAPPPLTGWENRQTPGAIAPRERIRLFEMVDEQRGHDSVHEDVENETDGGVGWVEPLARLRASSARFGHNAAV